MLRWVMENTHMILRRVIALQVEPGRWETPHQQNIKWLGHASASLFPL